MNTLRPTNADAPYEVQDAEALREAMIGSLREMGAVRTERIADVFRAVPRHLFTPGAPLEAAYDPREAVHVKWDGQRVPISTVSSPQLQGSMLEQADIRPGMAALEIGSGGANAAMMSWLAGPEGRVTTVDIDPDVTERARRLLDAAGYERVRFVLADAEHGVAEYAPYDRIIVTVGAWDIPPAWVEQLAPGGRLVVPLRVRGLTRSLELEREGDHLVSRSAVLCGFVAMQGEGANREHLVALRGTRAVLRFDDGWPGEQVPDLDGILDAPRAEAWSGVTIGGTESFETLQLWLATAFPGFGKLRADADQRPVLVDGDTMWFDAAAIAGDSFAYLTTRRVRQGVSEFGPHAFGPHASNLAEAMAGQVRIWDREQRRGPGPSFAVWPLDTSDQRMPEGLVVDKRHHRVSMSWPATTAAATGQGKQQEPKGREK